MNHSKHYHAGQSRGEMITRKASKTAIVRCKGIDGLSLGEIFVGSRGRCVMQKAC